MGDGLFAFLDAIAGGDNTARLAFADWLEDRDDPRGPAVRAAACHTVGDLFAGELMGRCEAAGDVNGWRGNARRLYYRPGGPPAEYAVSWPFFRKLVRRMEQQFDWLGADLGGDQGTGLLFMRVPVVIRDEQPVGV